MIPQGMEWVLIVLVIVLLFGGSQLPKLARSLGEARKEFEKGNKEAEDDERAKREKAKQLPTGNEADERAAALEREAELARREAELARREADLRKRD
ncbi:MAG: twin-arginine translocase TatA/TatE family subunit [Acidimicrobiales bacterium]|nr:twin-arginine translocase TatA/TatE family subunit [Acidimicrobiales bacterium]